MPKRRVKEKIVGEDRGISEKKIPDGGVTNRFGALFTRPIGMRIPLDRLDELDFCRLWRLGESGWSADTPRCLWREDTKQEWSGCGRIGGVLDLHSRNWVDGVPERNLRGRGAPRQRGSRAVGAGRETVGGVGSDRSKP